MKKTIKTKTIIGSICVVLVVTALLFAFTACGDNKDKELVLTTEPTIKEIVSSTEKAVVKPIEDETHSEISTTKESETELTTKPAPVPETTKKQEDKPVATTKKQEVNTTKLVTTTKATKPVTTIKPVTTTQKPTTTKAEYYPSLTAADMEELKRYAISYIESRGYRADPDITWNNAGYDVTVGINNDLSQYGDKFKVGVGIKPLDWAKKDMKEAIDYFIEDWERANGPDSIYGMYPLVRQDSYGWEWTIGYW